MRSIFLSLLVLASVGRVVAQIDDSASDKVVVVGNPSQPVAWNHRGTIADAIQKAQPSGTVVIPSSYTGTECNPISSCNPGNVIVIDWRTPQNLTSVTLGFQSLPPALPKIAMPPDPTGNCDYPSAYLLPGTVQICNLGNGGLAENWGAGNFLLLPVRIPSTSPADGAMVSFNATYGDWEVSGTNTSNFVGAVMLGSFTFATLPAGASNGTALYCTDCKNVTDDTTGTFDSAAASGGHGTIVLRENGAWRVH